MRLGEVCFLKLLISVVKHVQEFFAKTLGFGNR